jgi:hypothetical protein
MPVVLVLVAGAVLYLGRTALRTWSGAKTGCQSGCGCGPGKSAGADRGKAATLIPREQLTIRRRDPSQSA